MIMTRPLLSVLLFFVVMFIATGCGEINTPKTGKSTVKEMELTEVNHARLSASIPPPQLNTSLERKNLVKRLERLNQDNIVSYIYLLSYGKVMAHYTVDGKVSSLNSMLTTPTQVKAFGAGADEPGVCQYVAIPSPDFDGSYGANADGIFFFTTGGAYVEWQGEYLWSDQPLRITTPVTLVANVKE